MKNSKISKLVSLSKNKNLKSIKNYLEGFNISQTNYELFVLENDLGLLEINIAQIN
ncbi:MAG: hypothetical protein KTR26_10090 [Flammeovirgaceae bacterium]|nr:hypothetical protein [Flammeovirgaceae bacterium]